MDISRNRTSWLEQVQVVSFRWPRHDLDDLIDDIAAIAPGAMVRRADDVAARQGDATSLEGIEVELPDDAGMLNRTIGAIFHLSGDTQPAIKVSRGLRTRMAGDTAPRNDGLRGYDAEAMARRAA